MEMIPAQLHSIAELSHLVVHLPGQNRHDLQVRCFLTTCRREYHGIWYWQRCAVTRHDLTLQILRPLVPESGETDHWPAGLSQDDELAITEFPGKSKDSGGSLSLTHTITFSQRNSSHPDQSQFSVLQRPRSRAKAMQGCESHPACAPYLTILTISQQPDKIKCRILKAYILIRTYIISQNAWGVDDLRGSEAV